MKRGTEGESRGGVDDDVADSSTGLVVAMRNCSDVSMRHSGIVGSLVNESLFFGRSRELAACQREGR